MNVRDNFFDIGGHSLLAVRLLREINNELNTSLTIQEFFLDPTIEGIAKVLRQGVCTSGSVHLIPLRPAQSQGAVFFLDASMAMCRLASLLDISPAVFATDGPLSSPAYRTAVLRETHALPRLEDLAAEHVALIRSGNSFPVLCLLVGHPSAVFIAFEVAHQLRQAGTEVERILLLDTWRTKPPVWPSLRRLSWDRVISRLSLGLTRLQPKSVGVVEREPVDDLLTLEVVEAMHKIRDAYQFRPLESHAVLFRAEDSKRDFLFSTDRGALGWRDLFTEGLDIVDVPGDHRSMLEDPQVSVLAQKINEYLAEYSCSPPNGLAYSTNQGSAITEGNFLHPSS